MENMENMEKKDDTVNEELKRLVRYSLERNADPVVIRYVDNLEGMIEYYEKTIKQYEKTIKQYEKLEALKKNAEEPDINGRDFSIYDYFSKHKREM